MNYFESRQQLLLFFTTLDVPILKITVFMIMFQCSSYMIYFKPEQLSIYINGLIHYVQKDQKMQRSKLFSNLSMIFLYHLQIMQNGYDPFYHQPVENQVVNTNVNSRLKKSNLQQLKRVYKETFDILGLKEYEQDDENLQQTITWLHQEQLDHYRYELFQGYVFVCSGLHINNLSASAEQKAQVKIVQQLMQQLEVGMMKNRFTNINNYIEVELNAAKHNLLNQKLDAMLANIVKLQELLETGKQSKDFTDFQKANIGKRSPH